MSDFTLPLRSVLVVGKSGSGKNGWLYQYLLNVRDVSCRFIFDDKGECLKRLGVPHSSTANELEAALPTLWVNCNPHRMFPGELKKSLLAFCKWTFNACKRGRGRKIVVIDEVWRFQDRDGIPLELATLAQMGRAEGIELICLTQHPHMVNASITGNLTELVCFKLDESVDLKKIAAMGANAVEVTALPKGSFIAYNRDTGAIIRHKLFDPCD